MADGVIHRCTKECPYNKKCFVCKTESEVSGLRKRIFRFRLEKKKMPVFYDGQNSKLNNRTSL